MSALTPPRLEQALSLALARVEQLEAAATAQNLRILELETQRDVLLDERDAAVARAQGARHAVSQELRHQAAQVSVELRSWACSLDSAGRPAMAAAARARADKIVKALEG